jgi:NAD(P)-dependent dehydrogenase (short-subunit alcohol dehydrogenase family)
MPVPQHLSLAPTVAWAPSSSISFCDTARRLCPSRTLGAVAATVLPILVRNLDVTHQASVDAAAQAAADVTLLVNNAGVLGFGSALEGDLTLFDRDLATNYLGTLRTARAFVSS